MPNDNKRLKANNIKKVLNTVNEYYSDVLGMNMADFPSPDPLRVAEGSVADASKTLINHFFTLFMTYFMTYFITYRSFATVGPRLCGQLRQ